MLSAVEENDSQMMISTHLLPNMIVSYNSDHIFNILHEFFLTVHLSAIYLTDVIEY